VAPDSAHSSPELLSIIVPVHNERRTVRAVVDRLLAIDLPIARETPQTGSTSSRRSRRGCCAAGIASWSCR
jgi:hypothetical protein